jgi:Mg/Co/Ni transporter MgtE
VRQGTLLDPSLEPVTADTSAAEVSRILASYNLVSVPVVDEKHRLVGVVTIDDILDYLLPDDWRSQDEDEPVKRTAPSDQTGSIRIVNGRRGGSGRR